MFSVKPQHLSLTPGSTLTMNEAATIGRLAASVRHAFSRRAPLNMSVASLGLNSCFLEDIFVKGNEVLLWLNNHRGLEVDDYTKCWYLPVGFTVAKMSRLKLLLNYGPFPSLNSTTRRTNIVHCHTSGIMRLSFHSYFDWSRLSQARHLRSSNMENTPVSRTIQTCNNFNNYLQGVNVPAVLGSYISFIRFIITVEIFVVQRQKSLSWTTTKTKSDQIAHWPNSKTSIKSHGNSLTWDFKTSCWQTQLESCRETRESRRDINTEQ